jgi:hypothetical protein
MAPGGRANRGVDYGQAGVGGSSAFAGRPGTCQMARLPMPGVASDTGHLAEGASDPIRRLQIWIKAVYRIYSSLKSSSLCRRKWFYMRDLPVATLTGFEPVLPP